MDSQSEIMGLVTVEALAIKKHLQNILKQFFFINQGDFCTVSCILTITVIV